MSRTILLTNGNYRQMHNRQGSKLQLDPIMNVEIISLKSKKIGF